jgi:hypothetical protein
MSYTNPGPSVTTGSTITQLSSPATMGSTTSSTISFYGVTPIAQRSGAAQATSAVGTASSADVTTDLKAAVIEIMNTLTALGLWKGGA